ncbi:hypothetical protein JTE90_022572 [Oedothorax gibbosus]|uniref:MBD domain-containing protein n=1 Tax=Oedothorax gibbosus TaxID=931172 RepID=A0AAV6TEJ4_9ARAC|nr:hypothetical protein JTE90_022572 [Oedothorax gibbosus]
MGQNTICFPNEDLDSQTVDAESSPIAEKVARSTTLRRDPVTRPDGTRTDIYYYEHNSNHRLRTLKEIKNYCERNNLEFNPDIFDFSGKNKFSGFVGDVDARSVAAGDAGSVNFTNCPI